MKSSRNPFLRTILLLIPGVLLALSGAPSEAAVLEQYCQYPPYVVQTVLPSVTMLVSNSQSMGKFAYDDPLNNCATEATACGGFDPTKKYYGIFDTGSYYTSAGSNSGTKFSLHGKKTAVSKGTDDWDGNFLNWLTTRRIDVMKKVLTGGDGTVDPCMRNGNREIQEIQRRQDLHPLQRDEPGCVAEHRGELHWECQRCNDVSRLRRKFNELQGSRSHRLEHHPGSSRRCSRRYPLGSPSTTIATARALRWIPRSTGATLALLRTGTGLTPRRGSTG